MSLPSSGTIYIDANILIYRVEQIMPFLTATQPLWDALDSGHQEILTSELTLSEVLVKPLRTHDSMLERLFIHMLYATPGLVTVPLSRTIIYAAAHLRAHVGLKTPDALHAATAQTAACALFLTNDPAFRRVPGLQVVLLSEILAAP